MKTSPDRATILFSVETRGATAAAVSADNATRQTAVLAALRKTEEDLAVTPSAHAKVLMTTALGDRQNVMTAFREQADGYLVKPIDRARLTDYLKSFGLVP